VLLALSITGAIVTSAWSIEGKSSVAPAAGPAATLAATAADVAAPSSAAAPIVVTAGVAPMKSDPIFFGDNCCYVCDSIDSNFNGTAIPKFSHIWFSAVVNVKGFNGGPGVVHFTDGNVTFKSGSIDYFIDLPEATITFSDTATEATSDFDCTTRVWTTTVPKGYSGNVFLSGVAREFSDGLPGGINPVTVAGSFSSPSSNLSFTWKWAAAVYCCFSDCEDDLGVKPIDGDKINPYHNSDHAGTPENFKDCVTGGARGGGGSNWTGSYSGTSTAKCY
jgi:hypothetical protein